MTTISLPAPASQRATFLSAGLLWSLGILIVNILPVLFEALQHSRGLSEGQLGALGTAFVLGSGITSASGPFWVYRVNPKWASIASLFATALGLFGVAFVADNGHLTYWWFAIGLASGCVATPSYTALGYAADPLRAYSLAFFASLIIAATASYALPLVVQPQFGDKGVLIAIGAAFALIAPCAFKLADVRAGTAAPSAHPIHAGTSQNAARPAQYHLALAAPIVAALAGSAFTGVFMGGVYNFVGSLAATVGVDAKTVGLIVAATLMGAITGSILPSMLGKRVHTTAMIGIAAAVVVLSYPVMMSHSPMAFAIAFVIHGTFGTLGYTYYLGVVRRLDFTDRIYIAYPALQALGLAAGTAIAGYILERFTPATLYGFSAAVIIATWLSLVVAEKLSSRSRSDSSTEAVEATL